MTATNDVLETVDTIERWYAVRVKSRFEVKTSSALRAKGFTEFLPTCRSWRRWSDRERELSLCLFPGYVFCKFGMAALYAVLNSPGVVHIVSVGSRPIAVDEGEISRVRRICESGLPVLPWPQVQVGQRVLVTRGPLQGIEGIVLRHKDGYRLVASVSVMQRAVCTELESDWITPVPAGHEVTAQERFRVAAGAG
jgi:transcription antitermination factor NusG